MNEAMRFVLSIVVGVAVFFFVFWVPAAILIPFEVYWLALLLSLGCAIAAGRFVFRRTATADAGVGTAALLGALIVGGVCFAAGFFGPIIYAPEANQGPLLGLFITGPLGFLAGGVAGLVYGLWRKRGAKA